MINLENLLIESSSTFEDGARYLITKNNSNFERFKARDLIEIQDWLQMNDIENWKDITDFYSNLFLQLKPYSYKEAFELSNTDFRALVFSVINVPEMIAELGSTRIKTEGIELKNKIFKNGKQEIDEFTQIYELHKVDCTKLDLDEPVYAIKCWCTSTNEEHWLWIDNNYNNDPLAAIASTCKVYEPMIGNIKHIIRQGDVFLFEMENTVDIKENDKIVSLDKDTYFKLLKSQA